MPAMDGMSFCKTLRSTADGHFIYIILITADKSPDLMKQAFQAGVNDFIIKPLNHDELDARMLGARRFIDLHKSNDLEHENIRNYAFKLATATRQLESLAFTDQLTGLPNRRFATARLDLEWSKHIESGNSFAIFSLDLDHFKQVNDSFGHDVGDKVLVHFANTLQSVIRVNDLAVRMGGEEFIVIAPCIDEISVKMLGERIQSEVERNQPASLNLQRLITVSVGAAVADLSIDIDGWASTLKRSDQAVYDAKAAGRNTFKLHKNLQHRKHKRIASKLEIKIRNLSDQSEEQLITTVKNFSQGGAFINHYSDWRPAKGQVLEAFFEKQWKIAQVLRVDEHGYAVEFLNL